jgi:hypothetical protein
VEHMVRNSIPLSELKHIADVHLFSDTESLQRSSLADLTQDDQAPFFTTVELKRRQGEFDIKRRPHKDRNEPVNLAAYNTITVQTAIGTAYEQLRESDSDVEV